MDKNRCLHVYHTVYHTTILTIDIYAIVKDPPKLGQLYRLLGIS